MAVPRSRQVQQLAAIEAITEKAMEAFRESGLSDEEIRINLEDCAMRHYNGAKHATFFQISNHPTGETLWIENAVQDERSRVKVFVGRETDRLDNLLKTLDPEGGVS